jgi:hypothetical protein
LALAEPGGIKRGTLTIQAGQTIANYWLLQFLVRFSPGVSLARRGLVSESYPGLALDAGAFECP